MSYLAPEPGDRIIDGTLGGGGYALAALGAIGKKGRLMAIDLDHAAIAEFQQKVVVGKFESQTLVVHGNFSEMGKLAERHKFGSPNGIVLDLGLSSFQLDQSGRGFSFQKHEALDMRFDEAGKNIDARFILNHYDVKQLTQIFREFGEEHFAPLVARAVVRQRSTAPFHYTTDLVDCIQRTLPKPVAHKYRDVVRRVFQALRIAVNNELGSLAEALETALAILAPGGRLVVVTFHSLEDRIVKQFFVKAAKGCICPPQFPICQCGKNPSIRILTKKPVVASEVELIDNSRSKSAKLRAALKV